MPLHPWPLKEPWLNVYRGKVPRGLLPLAAPFFYSPTHPRYPPSLLCHHHHHVLLHWRTAWPPQSRQSRAQLHPSCPNGELMPALTLIRQWPLAWKRIPVCVCVCVCVCVTEEVCSGASLNRGGAELSKKDGRERAVCFRCVCARWTRLVYDRCCCVGKLLHLHIHPRLH